MSLLDNELLSEEEKREIAFNTVAGIRDTISIARKTQQPTTYEQSLRLIYDLDEELYNKFTSLLTEKNDNDTVKLYKEQAKIQSLTNKSVKIEAADLIRADIATYEQYKAAGITNGEDVNHITKRIYTLYAALENLKPRGINENAILLKDFSLDRRVLFGEKVASEFKYVDYKLAKDSFLRLRLLHPDQGERLTGADLVYEQYDVKQNKVRVMFLQYKTWGADGKLYLSQHENLLPQLNKMKDNLCACNFCEAGERTNDLLNFRLPHCAGFLRPTDKLQHKNKKMVSSGYHIPVCNAIKILTNDSQLSKNKIKKYAPNHYIFENLFNLNLIGSRWLSVDEVEEFYKEKKVLEPDETIKIYAREVLNAK